MNPKGRGRDDRRHHRDADKEESEVFDPGHSIVHFCEVVDAALVEVAARVMEIADRVSEDHARLEKEMLDLRLETLESAESVMDMALRVRKKAQRMAAGMGHAAGPLPDTVRRGLRVDCEKIDSVTGNSPGERLAGSGNRISMHDVGVAALFRKTH